MSLGVPQTPVAHCHWRRRLAASRQRSQTFATPANTPCSGAAIARNALRSNSRLPVAPERQSVLPLPGVPPASLGVVVAVALVETSALLAGSSQTTHLAVLVDWLDDPVDAGIAADGLVLWVDEDDLVVLVGGVLVDPVAVQDAQVGAAAADTLLGGGLEGALVLELVDTLVGGLACITLSAPLLIAVTDLPLRSSQCP